MSRSKPMKAQITVALQQVEAGRTTEDVRREYGVSKHTNLRLEGEVWRHVGQRRQEMKQLREENARLEKMVAELSLDKDMLHESTTRSACILPWAIVRRWSSSRAYDSRQRWGKDEHEFS